MLRSRAITAVILLLLFLCAVFFLPDAGWAALVTVMVLQGASEWSRLARLDGRQAKIFLGLTLLMVLGLLWLGVHHFPRAAGIDALAGLCRVSAAVADHCAGLADGRLEG